MCCERNDENIYSSFKLILIWCTLVFNVVWFYVAFCMCDFVICLYVAILLFCVSMFLCTLSETTNKRCTIIYNGCNYLSILGLKLNRVGNRGPSPQLEICMHKPGISPGVHKFSVHIKSNQTHVSWQESFYHPIAIYLGVGRRITTWQMHPMGVIH